MLSDRQIEHALRWRGLQISDFRTEQLQPASYDVRLGDELLVLLPGEPLDTRTDTTDQWKRVSIGRGGVVLEYGMFALGTTMERLAMGEHLTGMVEGKSSLGRLGLLVHITAGYLDPGFAGQVTLELACIHPRGVRLYAGMPIGQVGFDDCLDVDRPYHGKYCEQSGPTASRYHENWTGKDWR